jgi:hypothetical protein
MPVAQQNVWISARFAASHGLADFDRVLAWRLPPILPTKCERESLSCALLVPNSRLILNTAVRTLIFVEDDPSYQPRSDLKIPGG